MNIDYKFITHNIQFYRIPQVKSPSNDTIRQMFEKAIMIEKDNPFTKPFQKVVQREYVISSKKIIIK